MAQASTIATVEDLGTITDTDSHLHDSVDGILPYIDDRHRAVREVISETPEPFGWIFTTSTPFPPYLESNKGAGSIERGTLAAKLGNMEEFGIDAVVASPGRVGLSLPTVINTRAAVAVMNGYNSWLLAEVLDDAPDHLRASMLVGHQKPDHAAEEIDRVAGEDGVVGISLPQWSVPPLGDSRYDPIYEAAQDRGLPLLFHGSSMNVGNVFPLARKFNETFTEDHAACHPMGHMWELTSMIVQGVPERFPDLQFVFKETGIGWVPYMKWRLDDHYMSLAYEQPYVKKPPSQYIDDQFFFTTQPLGHTEQPDHMARMIELVGPGNVMYSSDLPHPDFDPPEELFNRIRNYFDDEVVRGIMGETAKELFGL